MKYPKFIYEVYSPGPCGDNPIGFFWDESEARIVLDAFNQGRYAMDTDYLAKHEIKSVARALAEIAEERK